MRAWCLRPAWPVEGTTFGAWMSTPARSRLVNEGTSPVVEPGLDVLISDAVRRGTLRATTDVDAAVDGADIVLVCVGTPATDHGRVDLRQVETAVSDIGRAFRTTAPPPRGRRSVVIRSTVPPGTVEELVRPTMARFAPGGCTYGVAMVPEFLREGSGVSDFFAPPFTVIGTDDALVGSDVAELFSGFDAPCTSSRRGLPRPSSTRATPSTRQGLVRERDRPAVPRHGRRLPRGDGALLRGRPAQHLPGLPAPGFRLRRLVPAQGPAGAAAPRPGEQRRPADARRRRSISNEIPSAMSPTGSSRHGGRNGSRSSD